MYVKFLVILFVFPSLFSTVWDAESSPFTDSSTVQVRLLHQLNQLLKVVLSLALAFLSRFSFSASRLPEKGEICCHYLKCCAA